MFTSIADYHILVHAVRTRTIWAHAVEKPLNAPPPGNQDKRKGPEYVWAFVVAVNEPTNAVVAAWFRCPELSC